MATKPIIEVSPIRSYQFCPKQYQFKYRMGLEPKLREPYLDVGTAIHRCLEAHYKGDGWETGLAEITVGYDKLFDEEKEHYGDIPGTVRDVMEAYFDEYPAETWLPVLVEETLEVEVGEYILKGRLDLVVQDELGRTLIIDHKSTSSIPEEQVRLLDPQIGVVYFMLLLKAKGIRADALLFNYLPIAAPTVPSVVKNTKGKYYVDGSGEMRLSARDINTTARAVRKVLAESGIPEEPYREYLETLDSQLSPHFRRVMLPYDMSAVKRLLAELATQAGIMHYSNVFPRHVGRHCAWCSYAAPCAAEVIAPQTLGEIIAEQFRKKEGR